MWKDNAPADFAEHINVEEGLARIRGNGVVYKAMLSAFLKDQSYAKLKEALEAGDLTAAEGAAHALKGMGGNLSFPAVFHLSTELDALLKNGERSEELEGKLAAAMERTTELVTWLQGEL